MKRNPTVLSEKGEQLGRMIFFADIVHSPIRIKRRQPGGLLSRDPWLSDTASRRLWLDQLSGSDQKVKHLTITVLIITIKR